MQDANLYSNALLCNADARFTSPPEPQPGKKGRHSSLVIVLGVTYFVRHLRAPLVMATRRAMHIYSLATNHAVDPGMTASDAFSPQQSLHVHASSQACA